MTNKDNFEKGCVRAEWKNGLDAFKIDYSDLHGFKLFAFLQSPSDEEVEKYSLKSDLVVYFDETGDVGFFTFRFSDEGGSCAFCPSLLLDYPTYKIPEGHKGYPMTVYVIDSSKGELLEERAFSFSETFSRYLRSWCIEADRHTKSLEEVMEASRKYFSLLSSSQEEHHFKVAFDSKRVSEHSLER